MIKSASRDAVVISVDQGTSSTKVIVVDAAGTVIGRSSIPVARFDPQPGWVEQDAAEIRDSVRRAISTAVAGLSVDVQGVGLSNQRESAIVWSLDTGQPLGPMLGWQDRRTSYRVREIEESGRAETVRRSTGLPLDPMFSALKIQWLLDQVDRDRARSREGKIAAGTVDSWIMYSLTGEHRIEMGNASRTQLLSLESASWDHELLEIFNIPIECLPRIAASDEDSLPIRGVDELPEGTRIHAVLGDSHAALYAHGVRAPGQVKATYGSGSSVMGIADPATAGVESAAGLVRTIAWANPRPVYAFEGTILSTGATLLWLSRVLGLEPAQLSAAAQSVNDSGGVDLVPAFAGLGAPYWDETAVATISGFGLGTGPAELARAAFESIALQTEAVLAAAEVDSGTRIQTVLADGGPTQNDWLMQLQADLSQREVVRSNVAELSAMGAAHLAGVSCGFWTASECETLPRERSSFRPDVDPAVADERIQRWEGAVARSRVGTHGSAFRGHEELVGGIAS